MVFQETKICNVANYKRLYEYQLLYNLDTYSDSNVIFYFQFNFVIPSGSYALLGGHFYSLILRQ